MAEGKPLLSAKGLERVFTIGSEQIRAVHDVDLEVFQGEFLAITGRSGSGKTTLLNLLAGLDRPTAGSVFFNGEEISKLSQDKLLEIRRKKIGFVFQSFALLPLLSAYENVELPLRINGVGIRERAKRVKECLGLVALLERANHRPYELSGGEQQRVAIARAVVNRPLLVLADEPTGELDSVTARAIFSLLRQVVDEGMTVVVATHDRVVLDVATSVRDLADGTFPKD